MRTQLVGIAITTVLTSAAMAEPLELEKDELTFGFIKLTDMAQLAVAYEQGYFLDEGLFVTLEAKNNWLKFVQDNQIFLFVTEKPSATFLNLLRCSIWKGLSQRRGQQSYSSH